MEYKVEFVIEGRELSPKEIEELQDSFVDSVEEKDLYTAGSIRKYTKLDSFIDWLWVLLHG